MIIDEIQLLQLVLMLRESIYADNPGIFSLNHQNRTKLLNEIMSQQSKEPREITNAISR